MCPIPIKKITTCLLAIVFSLPALFPTPVKAENTPQLSEEESEEPDFIVVPVAGPFEHPWSIAFLPDGGILLTERPGRLRFIPSLWEAPLTIEGLPSILTGGNAGLMDIVLDPDFPENQTIYLSYTCGTEEAVDVRIMKARLDLENLTLQDQQVIFESQPSVPGLAQFGGRMAFDREGFLYLTLGDRFDRDRAQKLSDDAGKIIRIRPNGEIPEDNPFVGVEQARPEIWTYGHRNSLGLAFDPATGMLWSNENGPMGGDELNLIERGKNYGWPVITYGKDYDGKPIGIGTEAPGMEQPVYQWTPSIAPSGLAIYGSGGPADWEGTIWLGALAGQMLVRLTMVNGRVEREEHFLKGEVGRIRDVRVGPDHAVYIVTDEEEGALYRLEPIIEQASRIAQ